MSVATEEWVLSALLLHLENLNDDALDIISTLSELEFTHKGFRGIFKTLKHLALNKLPINALSLVLDAGEALTSNQAQSLLDGGRSMKGLPLYVVNLKRENHANNCFLSIIKAYDKKNSDLETKEDLIKQLMRDLTHVDDKAVRIDANKELIESYIESLSEKKTDSYMATGDKALDKALGGGLKKKSIFILGGQSGTGKTTFSGYLTSLLSVKKKHKCAFFSTEMETQDISQIIYSHATGITRATGGDRLTQEQCEKIPPLAAGQDVANNIATICKKVMTVEMISRNCRILNAKLDLDYVIIDFISNIRTEQTARNSYEVTNIVMEEVLKIADDNNCAVILLSQVNRESTKVGDGRPSITSCKGSSSIENYADVLAFVYRESFDVGETPSHLEFILRKNRYGEKSTVFYESTGGTIFELPSQPSQKVSARTDQKRLMEQYIK